MARSAPSPIDTEEPGVSGTWAPVLAFWSLFLAALGLGAAAGALYCRATGSPRTGFLVEIDVYLERLFAWPACGLAAVALVLAVLAVRRAEEPRWAWIGLGVNLVISLGLAALWAALGLGTTG